MILLAQEKIGDVAIKSTKLEQTNLSTKTQLFKRVMNASKQKKQYLLKNPALYEKINPTRKNWINR